ncbi:hypothetical protein EG327_006948 [Venturia inaequalis]|uniref:ATP-dependent Clp protease proteolytic subunit n=1 Tax=Venturia inaequalis TaxID=5025 RepID=A0A8H3YZ79_VENIN|nr:hypothetical protein EG327_006948 [Venturia inaequalis]
MSETCLELDDTRPDEKALQLYKESNSGLQVSTSRKERRDWKKKYKEKKKEHVRLIRDIRKHDEEILGSRKESKERQRKYKELQERYERVQKLTSKRRSDSNGVTVCKQPLLLEEWSCYEWAIEERDKTIASLCQKLEKAGGPIDDEMRTGIPAEILKEMALKLSSKARRRENPLSSTRAYYIPLVTEITGGTWHSSDIYSRLLKERIILVNGKIDDHVASVVYAQLLFLESEAPEKAISMYINSPGGYVTSGLSIYDTMQYIRCPITTICMGQAMSMGSLLLAGGAPGQRYSLPHSSIMIHQPSGGSSGQASDLEIQVKEILRTRKKLNEIYQKHLTKPHTMDELMKHMDRDNYMDAEEALDFGLIDKILTRREVDDKTKAD